MNSFSIVFLTLLLAMQAAQMWLGWRHRRHISRHRHAVPAAFKGKILLSAHKKAADYTIAKSRFGLLDASLGNLLLIVWTVGGGLNFLDQTLRGLDYGPLITGTGFIVAAFLIMGVLDIPSSLYSTFVIEQRFGFNKTTPKTFILDLLIQAVLFLVIGIPLLLAVLWLMQETGDAWWLYVWLLWTGVTLLMVWAYPSLIAPLFNKFTPLKDSKVQKRIQALLKRTGFKSRGIYVMDGSRRSAHGNAYFTGFGKSKRIIFYDTLLTTLGGKEIEAVLAHELGHFKRRHVLKRMLLTFSISLAGLALLGWLMRQDWFFHGLGMHQPSTYAALMLFLLAGSVFTFFLSPLMAWGSRKHEFEADSFAAEQADSRSLVSALVKLYKENASTLTPDPLYSAFYDSHPPAPVRIAHLQALA
jgi:STE24 endopeptidase